MPNPFGTSFEYCAMRFLRQWIIDEKSLHLSMTKTRPTAADLRAGLAYFRVSRNFAGINERAGENAVTLEQADKTANAVIDRLLEASEPTTDSVATEVNTLVDKIKVTANQENISASSKLLWLRYRHPVVILDSRSVRALTKLRDDIGACETHKEINESYSGYFGAWHKCFTHYQPQIERAVAWLSELPDHARPVQVCDHEFSETIHTEWFRGRILDIYLWHVGAQEKRPKRDHRKTEPAVARAGNR